MEELELSLVQLKRLNDSLVKQQRQIRDKLDYQFALAKKQAESIMALTARCDALVAKKS